MSCLNYEKEISFIIKYYLNIIVLLIRLIESYVVLRFKNPNQTAFTTK